MLVLGNGRFVSMAMMTCLQSKAEHPVLAKFLNNVSNRIGDLTLHDARIPTKRVCHHYTPWMNSKMLISCEFSTCFNYFV